MLPSDDRCLSRKVLLHQRPICDNNHLSTQFHDRFTQFYINSRRKIDIDADPRYFRLRKSHHRSNHGISAGRNIDNGVVAIDIRRAAKSRPLKDHVCADERLTRCFVLDVSGNLACRAGEQNVAAEDHRDREEEHAAYPHHEIAPTDLDRVTGLLGEFSNPQVDRTTNFGVNVMCTAGCAGSCIRVINRSTASDPISNIG